MTAFFSFIIRSFAINYVKVPHKRRISFGQNKITRNVFLRFRCKQTPRPEKNKKFRKQLQNRSYLWPNRIIPLSLYCSRRFLATTALAVTRMGIAAHYAYLLAPNNTFGPRNKSRANGCVIIWNDCCYYTTQTRVWLLATCSYNNKLTHAHIRLSLQ